MDSILAEITCEFGDSAGKLKLTKQDISFESLDVNLRVNMNRIEAARFRPGSERLYLFTPTGDIVFNKLWGDSASFSFQLHRFVPERYLGKDFYGRQV